MSSVMHQHSNNILRRGTWKQKLWVMPRGFSSIGLPTCSELVSRILRSICSLGCHKITTNDPEWDEVTDENAKINNHAIMGRGSATLPGVGQPPTITAQHLSSSRQILWEIHATENWLASKLAGTMLWTLNVNAPTFRLLRAPLNYRPLLHYLGSGSYQCSLR